MRFFITAIILCSQLFAATAAPAAAGAPPRNVILIIGDGMDDQQISIARNYLRGASGKLLLDELPLRAAVGVLTIEDKQDGHQFVNERNPAAHADGKARLQINRIRLQPFAIDKRAVGTA